MQKRLLNQLERASRALVFCREHPSDLAGYQHAVTRLEEQIALADSLAGQAKAGGTATKEAIAQRNELRAEINAALRMLARIARTAGQEVVGTPLVISFPNPQSRLREFRYGAEQAVVAAQGREELLLKYGLPPDFLSGLATRLEELGRLIDRRDGSQQARVFANRDLEVAVSGLVVAVAQLHAINSYRFRGNPAALRTWASASDIRVGPRKPAAEVEGEAVPLALPSGPVSS